MDELTQAIAGREVLEVGYSKDAVRMRVVVLQPAEGGEPEREAVLLFELVGGRYVRPLPRCQRCGQRHPQAPC